MSERGKLDTEEQIERAIAILKQGGVVAFPTDTVYGIGANAFIEEAVERLYEIKGRPKDKPIPILLGDKKDMAEIAGELPELAWKLAGAFFPGGLTLVVRTTRPLSNVITAGSNTVALRVPDHPITLGLIRGLGAPLAATSANLSGQPPATTAAEVRRQLGSRVDFVMDGECFLGVESTVVDVTGEKPVILREGTISRQAIESVYQIGV